MKKYYDLLLKYYGLTFPFYCNILFKLKSRLPTNCAIRNRVFFCTLKMSKTVYSLECNKPLSFS